MTGGELQERLTHHAKQVFTLARDEAQKAHRAMIQTEHLLLGLLREDEGLAAKVLTALGVEIDKVRTALGPGPERLEDGAMLVPLPRVKRVMELAFEEANRMNNSYVGTEYLLLGLLIDAENTAAKVLAGLDVTEEKVRAEIADFTE